MCNFFSTLGTTACTITTRKAKAPACTATAADRACSVSSWHSSHLFLYRLNIYYDLMLIIILKLLWAYVNIFVFVIDIYLTKF